jgi:lysozyme
MIQRLQSASLAISAAMLVSIALEEGYSPVAYRPVKGDVATIGFGTTEGVKDGDKITPERALVRLLNDADKVAQAVRRCAPVPMYQYEFDAYVSLTYNIGTSAFCNSTLVKKLKTYDYEGACKEILRWDKFQGQPLKGLTIRRQREYEVCTNSSTNAHK